jgi:TRAP-type C4-dicarboxylate transport system substrate-binding protein
VFRPGGEFAYDLYEKSGGRIKLNSIEWMFKTSDEILAAVGTGSADMGHVTTSFIAGSFPLMNWNTITGIVKSHDEEAAVNRDPRMHAIFNKLYGEVGAMYVMTAAENPNNGIWSDKNVTSVNDLKGLKTRVAGVIDTFAMKTLGGTPVTLSFDEVEQALMRGTVDAVLTSLTYGFTRGLQDLVDYVSYSPMAPTYEYHILMNEEKFKSMPADLQQVIMDVAQDLQEKIIIASQAELRFTIKSIESGGCEVLYWSASEWDATVATAQPSVVEDWLKVAGPDGPEVLKIIEEDVQKVRAIKQVFGQ